MVDDFAHFDSSTCAKEGIKPKLKILKLAQILVECHSSESYLLVFLSCIAWALDFNKFAVAVCSIPYNQVRNTTCPPGVVLTKEATNDGECTTSKTLLRH